MKRNIKTWFLAVMFFSISSSCEDFLMEKFYGIAFFNNSDKTIQFYYVHPNSPSEYGMLYPDTSLPKRQPTDYPIDPNKDRSGGLRKKPEFLFDEIPSDTMSIFFYYQDTLEAHPWDTIRTQYKIAQRYDVSLQDLKNREFRVEFPYDSLKGKLKVWTEEL